MTVLLVLAVLCLIFGLVSTLKFLLFIALVFLLVGVLLGVQARR